MAAMFLMVVMLLGLLPIGAFAEDGAPPLLQPCENHQAHDENCGFAEAVAEAACGHVHDSACSFAAATPEVPCDKLCAELDAESNIIHMAECGYAEFVAEQPCTHAHDDTCGYAPAVAENPCTHTCEWCAPPLFLPAAVEVGINSGVAAGQTVYFGRYSQTVIGKQGDATADAAVASLTVNVDYVVAPNSKDSNTNYYYKIEPIAWRVLSNDGTDLFLIAEKNIDGGFQYNTQFQAAITWERSTIRSWLNGYAGT